MKTNRIRIYLFVIISKLCARWMPTIVYLKVLFLCRFGYPLNLRTPATFNEKLQWLKIHDRNPSYVCDVDKYAVRETVKKTVGGTYLIPLIGHYNTPNEIDYSKLPEKFVLKCTHGTHCSIICKDKSKLNIQATNAMLRKWLNHNYYYDAREWPYKNVKPSIVCEEFLDLDNDEEDTVDYKFLCFNGNVEYIMVHQDINNTRNSHTLDIYTPTWEKTNIKWGIPNSKGVLPKPKCLEECIHVCQALSKNRPHVRVDLYIVKDRVFFGELTYYSAGGFKPFENPDDDLLFGQLINIEGVNNARNRC